MEGSLQNKTDQNRTDGMLQNSKERYWNHLSSQSPLSLSLPSFGRYIFRSRFLISAVSVFDISG